MRRELLIVFLIVMGASFVCAQGFETSSPVLKSIVKQGERINNPLSIINLEKENVFEISFSSESNFLSIKDTSFILQEREDKTLEVFLDSGNLEGGVYVGEIIIKSTEQIVIPVVLEVESADLTFDSSIEILSPPGEGSGNVLDTNVRIFNLGSSSGNVDVYYYIKNTKGNILVEDYQTLFVANQAEFSKSYKVPGSSGEDYVFGIVTLGDGSYGTSSALFTISDEVSFSPERKGLNSYLFVSFGVILVLIVAFLIFNHYWNQKVATTAKTWNKKFVDLKKVKLSDVNKEIVKLEHKKSLLKRAYEKGYITRVSYEEGRKKMNEMITKLKKRL